MNINCPNCKKDFQAEAVAIIPESQTITMALGLSSETISAETLGKMIVNFEKLQKAVASNLGHKVHIFVKGLSMKDKRVEVEFFITSVAKQENTTAGGTP